MKTQKRFPKILLCITLILAFILSGITRPGFLLPFFEVEISEPEHSEEDDIGVNGEIGNSSAFEINADDGFSISAQENALDRDREFAVSQLMAEDMKNLTEKSLESDDIGFIPLVGWTVDAGMEPGDVMLGVFHMEFDLAEYGIPEDMYTLARVYHIDDEGKWEEYSSELRGAVLCADARHNGIITVGLILADAIWVPAAIGAALIGFCYFVNNPDGTSFSNEREFPVYEKDELIEVIHTDAGDVPKFQTFGKKLYTIKFNLADNVIKMEKTIAQIEADVYKSCEEEAGESMKREFGENYLQNMNLGYAYTLTVVRQLKLYSERIKENKVHKYTMKQLKNELEVAYPWESVHKLADLVRTSHYYLRDVAKVKMPTCCPIIYMNTGDGDATTDQKLPNFHTFTVIKTGGIGRSENTDTCILSTLTHEMAHQCQREYCARLAACAKYDEACAQLLEEQAYEWYKSHSLNISLDQDGNVSASFIAESEGNGIMRSEPDLNNGQDFKYYSCEMDGSTSYTWLSSKSTEFRHNYGQNLSNANTKLGFWSRNLDYYIVGAEAQTGYPYARFLDYLWKDYEAGTEQKMTWNRLFNMYLWVDFPKPSLSSLLKKAFKLDESGLTKKYTEFAEANKTVFYGYSIENEGQYYNPTIGSRTKNGGKIKLKNQNYTIMTRFLDFYYPEGYNRQASLLLKQDEGFKTTFPDMTLIPIGNTDCQPCKHGLFYNPQSLEALIQGAILEVDGGTQGIVKRTWNWFTSPKVAEGYSLWTLLAPDEITPEVKNGQIVFRMPEKSDAVEAKLIDGYRVTYFASTSPEKPYIEELDTGIAGQERSLNLDKLIPEDLISQAENEDLVDRVTFTVSVCEFIKDQDGTKHYGPESNPGGGMSALLSEMGAHDGRITVTLHWFGPDDLDLHCITPMGGHISYENKESDGGYLDVDMNIEGDRRESVEHIYFDKPDAGDYQFYVVNYTDRTDGDCTAEIYISVEGKQIIADKASMGGRSKTWKIRTYPATKKESGAEYLIAEPVTDG